MLPWKYGVEAEDDGGYFASYGYGVVCERSGGRMTLYTGAE